VAQFFCQPRKEDWAILIEVGIGFKIGQGGDVIICLRHHVINVAVSFVRGSLARLAPVRKIAAQ
jgi:hypothetical protein